MHLLHGRMDGDDSDFLVSLWLRSQRRAPFHQVDACGGIYLFLGLGANSYQLCIPGTTYFDSVLGLLADTVLEPERKLAFCRLYRVRTMHQVLNDFGSPVTT